MTASTSSPPPHLAIHALHYTFSSGFRLGPLSFSVAHGDILGIIGANGSGKSTLLRLIAHTLPSPPQTILLDGQSIATLPRRSIARHLAVIPQRITIAPGFRVYDVVALGRTPYARLFTGLSAVDRQAVTRALELTEVTHLAQRDFRTLSGGEQQRALLAMALAQETPLLLLDEPVTHLDPHHAVTILDLLSRLRSQYQLTVLLTLHDLNLAALYCPRLLLLSHGQILRSGSPASVLEPALLHQAFGSGLSVIPHPTLPLPLVLPVSQAFSSSSSGVQPPAPLSG